MQVWNVLRAAHWKYSTQKSPSGHNPTTLLGYIFTTMACIDNRKKNLLRSNSSSTCPHKLVNFGPLAAEIVLLVWGTPANFNWFRILVALLHDTLVVGVSQTLWRWTEGATYIRQGGHHVGHWSTFLVHYFLAVVPRGRVSLVPISFSTHIKHFLSYHILTILRFPNNLKKLCVD